MVISAADFAERMKNAVSRPFKKLVSGKSEGGYGKNNLPPLLGRRDARWCSFVAVFSADDIERTSFERIAIYRSWCEILDGVIEDTELIIAAMCSEDGIMREQRLLNMLRFLLENVLAAAEIAVSEIRFTEGEYAIGNFIPAESMGRLRKRIVAAKNTEASILNGIGDIMGLCRDSIRRHREYACKSASSHNLTRYRSAFAEYSEKLSAAAKK